MAVYYRQTRQLPSNDILLNVTRRPADIFARNHEVGFDSSGNEPWGLEADPQAAPAFQGQETEKVLSLHFQVSRLDYPKTRT